MFNGDDESSTSTLVGPIDLEAASRLASALSMHWPDDETGTTQSEFPRIGDYVLDRRLGEGGGGTVFHGILPGWNDDFAIKYLHTPIGEGRAAARARRELDIVEQLDLPVTPRVFEYGVHDGRLYIVSEHVEGEPLDVYCAKRNLDRRARVELLVRVAHAIHALHEHGVIHRDLKPTNILVRADGSPMVIDLGIAMLLDAEPAETITTDGAAIGSVAFMAPEQARGATGAISIRSDVYGLGATACLILTGHTPHDVEGLNVLHALQRVGSDPIRDPRRLDTDLPAPLQAILQRALAADAKDRFVSAAELADDFERWLDNEPVRSQSPSWWRNRVLSMRRHPGHWAWGLTTAALTAALLALGAVGRVHAAETRVATEWNDRYEAVINTASRVTAERMLSGDFVQALGALALFESHVRAGSHVFDAGNDMAETASRLRDELTTKTLTAIHDVDAGGLSARDLAGAAVRSVYERAGLWNVELEAELDLILLAHDSTEEPGP